MAHEPSDAVNVGVELPSTRIRFPDPARSSQSSSLSKATSLGLGLPSTRRQPISQDNHLPAAYRNDDRRRRVRSAQGASFGDVSTPPASRRRASMVDGKGADGVRPRRVTASNPPFAGIDEVEHNVFSDEYDLSHEDPKILEEVQHALKLKMRREARQRAPLVTAPSKSTISTAPSSQFQPKIPGPSFSRITKTKVESELDFSPSISIHNLHPVPISFNDGHTLDWSWPEDSEDTSEKRWPISLPKRKTRDRPPPTPSKEFLDRQQARWTERLATIKGSAAPRTLRKADITRTQLERRYRALYPSLGSGKEPLNPVRVVSWYSKLDAPIQTSLDDAEPYTWLRHLRDRHFARTGRRLPWHMSAHLVEEFLEHPHRHGAMFAIPENSLPPSSLAYPSSPAARSFESTSEVSPYKHLTTSSLNRVSLDGNVSFEPFVDYPGRRSGGEESRRSFEGVARHRRRPTLESPGSSLYSASSQPELAPSPSSSRARMRGLPILSRAHDSDDLASPHQSMSEDSDGGKKRKKRNIRLRPTGLDFTSIPKPLPEVYSGEEDDVLSREPSLLDVPVAPKSPMMTAKAQGESFPTSASTEAAVSRPQFQPRTSSARVLRLRGYRNSLPSSQPDSTNEGRWQQYVDEEAMYLEYERRRQIFQDLATQNVENRYVLHRVQDSVLEYQRVMSRISKNLQVPYTPLPQEFVDELGHDPAVILGHTTKWKHYQAVDAMHHALLKQRATLEKYLQQRDIGVMRLPEGSVMTAWIEDVNRSLIEIEKEQPTISEKTKEVSEMLDRVRKLHAAVKAEYHETVTHTSAVYPEMSQIITLEDRYKNRYQQLWGIAMDFVTFMLDAVIPFWRNYGKVIGVDVQDFLIIPLYRNEFTGEAKRYPIVKLPRRSFRHWVALTLIFCGNIALWYFQARGVWVSCRRYRIPLLVKPTFWVLTIPLYCMFVGIQVFFVFLEATGLSLHLVVILWWLAWWASLVS